MCVCVLLAAWILLLLQTLHYSRQPFLIVNSLPGLGVCFRFQQTEVRTKKREISPISTPLFFLGRNSEKGWAHGLFLSLASNTSRTNYVLGNPG
uniref:Putative secreted protein n=1 Tax=Anopheles marajoara TaxID=58244 RepID=A0A2M4C9Z8_9DIPT